MAKAKVAGAADEVADPAASRPDFDKSPWSDDNETWERMTGAALVDFPRRECWRAKFGEQPRSAASATVVVVVAVYANMQGRRMRQLAGALSLVLTLVQCTSI